MAQLKDLIVSGKTKLLNTLTTLNILPSSDGLLDIGESGNRFRNIYGDLIGNATTSSYPFGFKYFAFDYEPGWGISTGDVIVDWGDDAGGDIMFRKNCPNDGLLSLLVDGRFYLNEGRYMCLDTNNYKDYSLPLTGGTLSGPLLISYDNYWLTPSLLQLGRYGATLYSDRAVIGVTDGNLHIDAYSGKNLYLNYYGTLAGTIYLQGLTYFSNTLRIDAHTGSYCEGIRLNASDGLWVTIAMGCTSSTGSNTNCWSIHRKNDNNFCISKNSSDGSSGLVMTSTGMGLGTTAPSARLHVVGDVKFLATAADHGLTIYKTTTIANNYPAKLTFLVYQSDNKLTSTGYIACYNEGKTVTYGTNMVIQSGGNMFIGGGESPSAVYSESFKTSTAEDCYVTADGAIYFYVNCQTIANKKTTCYVATTGVLYGAAWNDYAEYRTQKEEILPGYCVTCGDNGELYKTSERLQTFEGITSDTFGFAIGESEECKTPLAVAGRVLVYTYEPRETYHLGDCVCAGPDGRVSKMSRKEIIEWPDRIVGIVSEIPEYEVWGQTDVLVDGRIWIKVR